MKPISTNIITGFLGVGKTTTIRHLLSQKPKQENWAILVNEFGEVGIDGALMREHEAREGGISVKEIPGGCMCCTAGLPMRIGLTQLLRSRQFDRLIIEPTGLGHPVEVLQTLKHDFADVVHIKACLTLVNPQHFISERHLQNDTFGQQLQMADALIINKMDLASEPLLTAMDKHLQSLELAQRPQAHIEHGRLPKRWLELEHQASIPLPETHAHHSSNFPAETLPTPSADQPINRKGHAGQGYFSIGWVIHPGKTFSLSSLLSWLHGLECDRLKAVLITDEGVIALNLADSVVKMLELDECNDSRLEIISHQPLDEMTLEQELKQHIIEPM
ncbi:CobW family GTP-binding protein [Gilvimarinus chinensis]|uniref:CobW family GTP-binding protein n=1 Tax=Gilvimarinus chinensis TaxID=396005 RepID=UPI000361F143|nr:GTP-binding protein [Gilvimarinus chinensis]